MALGPGGVVEGITPGKGYVDMSTVDSATSLKIAEVCIVDYTLKLFSFAALLVDIFILKLRTTKF